MDWLMVQHLGDVLAHATTSSGGRVRWTDSDKPVIEPLLQYFEYPQDVGETWHTSCIQYEGGQPGLIYVYVSASLT